jgi:hypothetical protein
LVLASLCRLDLDRDVLAFLDDIRCGGVLLVRRPA